MEEEEKEEEKEEEAKCKESEKLSLSHSTDFYQTRWFEMLFFYHEKTEIVVKWL